MIVVWSSPYRMFHFCAGGLKNFFLPKARVLSNFLIYVLDLFSAATARCVCHGALECETFHGVTVTYNAVCPEILMEDPEEETSVIADFEKCHESEDEMCFRRLKVQFGNSTVLLGPGPLGVVDDQVLLFATVHREHKGRALVVKRLPGVQKTLIAT